MEKTWILVADARRARCFERADARAPLTEVADFIYPHGALSGKTQSDELTGPAGTQFVPHAGPGAKERSSFARQLANFLNAAVSTQQCNALILIASSPMLGELKLRLSISADKLLKRCITGDLTHYRGPELNDRVRQVAQV